MCAMVYIKRAGALLTRLIIISVIASKSELRLHQTKDDYKLTSECQANGLTSVVYLCQKRQSLP